MDYEKSYKDALDRAKKLKETSDSTAVIDGCEQIFPELQGNEDEKMRKWIIDGIRYNMSYNMRNETLLHLAYKKKAKKAIAWLEKQRWQKPSWSEEDELMLKDAIEFIETGWSDKGKSHLVNWLKSFKDRCSRKSTEEQIKKTMEE